MTPLWGSDKTQETSHKKTLGGHKAMSNTTRTKHRAPLPPPPQKNTKKQSKKPTKQQKQWEHQ